MSALPCLHLRSRVSLLAWSQTHTTPVGQLGAHELSHCEPARCPQPMAPVSGMCSRVLCVVQKPRQTKWKGAGNSRMPFLEQAYPHHPSKRPEWPLPRNGAQGSQTCHLLQLARMLNISMRKPQQFASNSTGICFPSTDQSHPGH